MTYFSCELTDHGYLPAGTDVAEVLRHGNEREYIAVWLTYHHIRHMREFAAQVEESVPDVAAYTRRDLEGLAEVSELQALEANRRAVDLLTGRRWSVMQYAREGGSSWSVIGKALEMTKQGALDWYRRKIDQQAKYVPEYHDSDRARAVIDE